MFSSLKDGRFAIGLIVFLVTLAAFFVGWTHIRLETAQRVSEHYERQNQIEIREEFINQLCPLGSDGYQACVIGAIEEQEQWGQERRDLHAQEKMALWAFWMFVLTSFALIAIVRTLHHTRRAADATDGMLTEAKNTTAAARSSIAVALDVGNRQVDATLRAIDQARLASIDQMAAQLKPTLEVTLSAEFIENFEEADKLIRDGGAAEFRMAAHCRIANISRNIVIIKSVQYYAESAHMAAPFEGDYAMRDGESVWIENLTGHAITLSSDTPFHTPFLGLGKRITDRDQWFETYTNLPAARVVIAYEDAIGTSYEASFARQQAGGWGGRYRVYGGKERNYDTRRGN